MVCCALRMGEGVGDADGAVCLYILTLLFLNSFLLSVIKTQLKMKSVSTYIFFKFCF